MADQEPQPLAEPQTAPTPRNDEEHVNPTEPAAVNATPPTPKPAVKKFQPRAVSLNFIDVMKYLDELDSLTTIPKVDAPLDIISLGTFLIIFFF